VHRKNDSDMNEYQSNKNYYNLTATEQLENYIQTYPHQVHRFKKNDSGVNWKICIPDASAFPIGNR